MNWARKRAVVGIAWLVCAAVVVMPNAAPGQEKATKKEIIEKLKGGWEVVAHDFGGKFEERKPPYTSRFFFEAGGVLKMRTNEDPNEVTGSGIWTIVEVRENSFKMNIDITEGESVGETFVGIAKFDEGKLIWSNRSAKAGGGRPDQFVSKEGDPIRVYTMQSIK